MSRKNNKAKKNNCKTKVEFVRSICKDSCQMCLLEPKDVVAQSEEDDDLFCYDYMYKYRPGIFMADALPRLIKQNHWPFDTTEEPPSFEECTAFKNIFCHKGLCPSAQNGGGNNYCREIDFCIIAFREYIVACIDPKEEGRQYSADDIRFLNGDSGNAWDKVCAMTDGVATVAERVIFGPPTNNNNNNNNKKFNKKQRKAARRAKQKALRAEELRNKTKRIPPEPTPCFFSNLNTEQIEALDDMLLNGNNNSEQDQTEASAGAP